MERLFAHFPDAELATVDDVIAAGGVWLADQLVDGRDPRLHLFANVPGPGGRVGTMAMAVELDDVVSRQAPPFDAERQTWIPASDDADGAMVGWERAFPPGWCVLKRLRQYDGAACRLSSEVWLLPYLDQLPLQSAPGAFYRSALEEPSADVVAAHELALQVRDEIHAGGAAWQRGVLPPRAPELVAAALTLNYRGPRQLWDHLQLFADPQQLVAATMTVTGITRHLAEKAKRLTSIR